MRERRKVGGGEKSLVGGRKVVRDGVRILQLGGGQVKTTRRRAVRGDRSWVDGTAKGLGRNGTWTDVEWMGGGRWSVEGKSWWCCDLAAAAAAGRQHSGKS